MALSQQHYVDVRVVMNEVQLADLKPGGKVWYYIKKSYKKGHKDAHGPFTVVATSPKFRLRNPGGIELDLDPDLLHLLVVADDPPTLL
jgi:hypothetical protein